MERSETRRAATGRMPATVIGPLRFRLRVSQPPIYPGNRGRPGDLLRPEQHPVWLLPSPESGSHMPPGQFIRNYHLEIIDGRTIYFLVRTRQLVFQSMGTPL